MMSAIKIAVWNANGLAQHILELWAFMSEENIDVMLVSETHLTDKNFLSIPNYTLYNTNHPAKTAPGGSAIILKNTIAHCNSNFYKYYIQATSIFIHATKFL